MWICPGWQSLTFIRRISGDCTGRSCHHSRRSFYAKLYRLRIVEQKRFVVGGAKYAEDLKRFHQLQDEYLLLVNNDIKSIVELVDFISEKEDRIQQMRTGRRRYTEKVLVGNEYKRMKSSTGNIRYGMWKCRKNWTN